MTGGSPVREPQPIASYGSLELVLPQCPKKALDR